MTRYTMVQAIGLTLKQAMRRDESVVVLGQDVGVDGGVFRVTEGLYEEFGASRVIDTPLAEAAIIGTAIGMSLNGLKPVCEIQFSGFSYQGFHQLEQHAARFRTRTRGRLHCPLVVRMPFGGGIRALEHHSESREVYFAHTPGLKIVIPSSPSTARGLLIAAIADPDPVVFFEPKAVYRAFREEIDEEAWDPITIGRARVVQEGSDLTLISYGASLRHSLEAVEALQREDQASVEVLDLLSISPMDTETVAASVTKTGRAIVVHEAPRHCGVGAEVVARLVEKAFLSLEAPVRRVTGFDVHMPYFAREKFYIPGKERIVQAARETLAY